MKRVIALTFVLALLPLLCTCDGGTTEPPVEPVASVEVGPANDTIEVGQTLQLTATSKDAAGNVLSGRTITWWSSNVSVATVSGTGLVTGVGPGSATITATSEGKSGTASVTVTPVPVASVEVSPANDTIEVGQTLQLTATSKDAAGNVLSGRTITWWSSNVSLATVSQTGLVTGLSVGIPTITATCEGIVGSASVTVTPPPVASVEVIPQTAPVSVGGTIQLSVVLRASDGTVLTGRTVIWSSSALSVATVYADGSVTGVTEGTATITATSEGKTGTAQVLVQKLTVDVSVEGFSDRVGIYDTRNESQVLLCSGSFWATASGSLSTGFAEWVDARHYWRLLSSSDWTYATHEDLSWVLGIWGEIRQLSHGQTVQSGGWAFWWGGSGLNGWEVRVVFRYNVFPGKALQEAEVRFICRPPS